MKKSVIIFSLFFICNFASKADTLDYWHIYYNDVLIIELNEIITDFPEYQEIAQTITLKKNDIKENDTISIDYFCDYRSDSTDLIIENPKTNQIIFKGKMSFRGITSLSMQDVLSKRKEDENVFFVYQIYVYGYEKSIEKRLLFIIKLE